ncbi:hypothetical protein NBV64_09065 [Alcaligenes sp. DN25]|uniref:hypothetical protein n=1 Tax=Alcaligenes TaxID=507 RepID=UPI00202DBE6D|nr:MULTISPECIES: hypothetical protein [Alcaligenes]URW84477.1 hypothetical protein NBV64_09065 [Alcaligenes sp. DN25]WEA69318.1 hypothetical protein PWH35_09090 [Alcaligenes faecalis]
MKYASEVIGLLGAHPGRAFKMIQIVRHVADRHPGSPKEWERVRKGVRRVLDSLEESGQVSSTRIGVMNGGSALYQWKPGHELMANRDVNRDNISKHNCAHRF